MQRRYMQSAEPLWALSCKACSCFLRHMLKMWFALHACFLLLSIVAEPNACMQGSCLTGAVARLPLVSNAAEQRVP